MSAEQNFERQYENLNVSKVSLSQHKDFCKNDLKPNCTAFVKVTRNLVWYWRMNGIRITFSLMPVWQRIVLLHYL